MAVRKSSGGGWRITPKGLFRLHGWLGMNFGLLLAIICLSGAIATVSHEVEWLMDPTVRISPKGEIRWQDTLDALQQAHSGYSVDSISRGESTVLESMAWSAFLTDPGGGYVFARVDPYVGEVTKSGTRLTTADYIRQLHYNFHSTAGFYLVCFVAFPLVFSVTSGLMFLKGWWKHLFALRLGKGRRVFISSLHRFLGVWSMLFGLLIGVTGIWYLVERDLIPEEIAYPEAPGIEAAKMESHGSDPKMLPLDSLVAIAREAYPGLEAAAVELPQRQEESLGVIGNTGAIFTRDRAAGVFLDPYDGAIIAIRRSEDAKVVRWWVDAADSLHFGYWGGLTTKILWCAFGIALPALVLTGAWLSLRRSGAIGPQSGQLKSDFWRRRPLRTWTLLPLLLLLTVSCVAGYFERALVGDYPTPPPSLALLVALFTLLTAAISGVWLWLDRTLRQG